MSYIQEAVMEWIHEVGRDRPLSAWILSPYDTWHKNPFYVGEPQPHPEDNEYEYEEEESCSEGLENEWPFPVEGRPV